MTNEAILSAALKLDHKSRAELAHRLLESLDELPESEWEQVWAQEAERRLAELREGKVKEIPADEVFARARALRS